jgi:hypothetical protein
MFMFVIVALDEDLCIRSSLLSTMVVFVFVGCLLVSVYTIVFFAKSC